jgi:hypothetical protein
VRGDGTPAPPGPSVLLSSDNFNRANSGFPGSTSGPGSRDPLAWTTTQGQLGISTNQLYAPAAAADGYVDLGTPNVDISITLAVVDVNGIGIMCRYGDLNNHVYFTGNFNSNWNLIKRVSGVNTGLLGGLGFINSGGGSVVRIKADGDNLSVYIDGALKGTVTDSWLNTTTTHGVRMQGSGQRIDNWTASSVPQPGVTPRRQLAIAFEPSLPAGAWVKCIAVADAPDLVADADQMVGLPPMMTDVVVDMAAAALTRQRRRVGGTRTRASEMALVQNSADDWLRAARLYFDAPYSGTGYPMLHSGRV